MMNTSLTLHELRELMARMESQQDKVRKRWKSVVARFTEIEEEVLRIEFGASAKAGGKRPRPQAVLPGPAKPKPVGRRKKAGQLPDSPAAVALHEPAQIEAPASPAISETAGFSSPAGREQQDAPPAPQPSPKRRGRPRKSEIPAAENPHAAPLPEHAEMLPSSATPPKRLGRGERQDAPAQELTRAHSQVGDAGQMEEEGLDRPPGVAEIEERLSSAPEQAGLTDCLFRILQEADRALSLEELASAAEEAGFGGENLEESIQNSILNGPFRETVGGLMLQKPASSARPLADLLEE